MTRASSFLIAKHWSKLVGLLFVLLAAFPAVASVGAPHVPLRAYDDAGEFVAVERSGGPKLRCAYRKDGALMEAAADDVVVAFERDALGQLVKESVTGIEDDAEDWVASASAVALDLPPRAYDDAGEPPVRPRSG